MVVLSVWNFDFLMFFFRKQNPFLTYFDDNSAFRTELLSPKMLMLFYFCFQFSYLQKLRS